MDSWRIGLDNPNMASGNTQTDSGRIPRYGLYGERPMPPPIGMLHCESIAARSRLHAWEIAPHVHEAFLQILYVRRGSGWALLETSEKAIRPPCVVLVPASRLHGFRFSPDIDGEVFTAVQDQIEAWPALRALGFDPRTMPTAMVTVPRTSRARAGMEQTFAMLAEEIRSSAVLHSSAAQSLLTVALIQIFRAIGMPLPGTAAVGNRSDRRIRRFLALVDLHFRQRLAVGDYARQLGITATHLGRLTRERLGCTPLQAVEARLIREAQRDLVYSALSVKAIALELGFGDPAYFSRFFRQRLGQTPAAFRDAARRALRD
jgi:AraC family transcriptional regulator, transcriptional activator of pobA